MKQLKLSALSLALTVAFCGAALAADMSKDQYKAAKTDIGAKYKTERAACDSLAANAKDICVVEAKGKEKVARAELEAGYKPSLKASYKVSVAQAEANYSMAREKCDDKAGNDKDVCVKEAKAAEVAAKADSTAARKTSDANKTSVEKTTAARTKASETGAEARKDAATDKRNADYAVAKEKCDKLASDAKDACIKDAKVRFGQT